MHDLSVANQNRFVSLSGGTALPIGTEDLLGAVPDALLLLDASKKRALAANIAFLTMTGRDVTELNDSKFHPVDVIHQDDHHAFHTLGDPGAPDPDEPSNLRILLPDGGVLPVEAFGRFLAAERDRALWVYFFRPVERRRQLEQALEEQIRLEKKRTVEAVKSSLRIYQLTEKVRAAPKLSTLLLDVRSEEELFRRAGDFLVSEGLNYQETAIFLLEEEKLMLRYSSSNRSRMSYDVKKGNRYARFLLDEEQPAEFDNVQLVALRTKDKPIGVLEVTFDPRERALFQENQLIVEWNNDILETIAEILALFLENIRLYQKLRRQTMLDPLTSVYNRHYLISHLEHQIAQTEETGRPLSLVFTDVDGFKAVNDENGHHNGDLIIQEIAFLLQGALRDSDIICRYGGDEFVVLLPDTDLATAEKRADELRMITEEHRFRIVDRSSGGTKAIKLTISAGVASTEAGRSAHDLLQGADLALYGAKSKGKNCVYHIGDPEPEAGMTLTLPSRRKEDDSTA